MLYLRLAHDIALWRMELNDDKVIEQKWLDIQLVTTGSSDITLWRKVLNDDKVLEKNALTFHW